MRRLHIEPLMLAVKRPYRWRALLILWGLYLLGNLAALPLLADSDAPLESPTGLIFAITLTFVIIGAGLFFAARTGIGAPLIEGDLPRDQRGRWLRRIVALALLIGVVAGLIGVALDVASVRASGGAAGLAAWRESLSPRWKLLLASVDAGVQEEIGSRLFVMSLLAWLGGLLWRDEDGRPSRPVMIGALLLSGLLFGVGHIDDELAAGVAFTPLIRVLITNTLIGIVLGWLYWRQGLEAAMLAHFALDALATTVFLPALLAANGVVYAGLAVALIAILALCGWLLWGEGQSTA